MSLDLCDSVIHECSNALIVNWLTLTVMSNMILDIALIAYHHLVLLTEVTNWITLMFVTGYLVRVLFPILAHDLL